jgi:hypothetical protein
MFDTFPFDEWGEDIAEFWTWGGANSTGTYILTVLGCILMVLALVYFVRLEKTKLDAQAERLRTGMAGPPAPPQPGTTREEGT